MKKILYMTACWLIVFTAIMITACDKAQTEAKQPNGLSYTFMGYIGPDSCKLYWCYYGEDQHMGGNGVYMTQCDHSHTLSYMYGKRLMMNSVIVTDSTGTYAIVPDTTVTTCKGHDDIFMVSIGTKRITIKTKPKQ